MRPFVAGNWKMNNGPIRGKAFFEEIKKFPLERAEVVIFPPFITIPYVKKLAEEKGISLGAQNAYWRKEGAFTGEISLEMLIEAGVDYVLVGHSERRNIFGESDEEINLKLKAVLRAGLRPVLCVGENLAEREEGRTREKVRFQLDADLSGIVPTDVIIAYEPIWAIGTGKTATPEQAEEVHAFIKEYLGNVRVIYGGSVKPENAHSLMAQPHVDGVLVGGASLKPASFYDIILAGIKAFEEKG